MVGGVQGHGELVGGVCEGLGQLGVVRLGGLDHEDAEAFPQTLSGRCTLVVSPVPLSTTGRWLPCARRRGAGADAVP
jgi:hypothetical protein